MGIYIYPLSHDFLNLTGGTVSGNTFVSGNLTATTIYSGSTELSVILNQIASSAAFDVFDVGVGFPVFSARTNGDLFFRTLSASGNIGITTGDTIYFYLKDDIAVNSLSGNVIQGLVINSGNTSLNNLFSHSGHTHEFSTILNTGHTHSITDVNGLQPVLNTKLDISGVTAPTRLINGLNTFTGGTDTNPSVNISALTITDLIVSGNSNFSTIQSGGTNLSLIFASTGHTHQFSQILNTGHTHQFSEISNTGHTHEFSTILNTAHTHSIGEIDNLGNVLNTKLDISAITASVKISNGLNTFTGGTVTNPTVNISGLTVENITSSGSAVFNIINSGNTNLNNLFSHSGHTHQFSQILNTGHTHQFNEILNTAHTHSIGEINNLSTILNTKADISGLTYTHLQNGNNTYTGGTAINPTVNVSALTIENIFVSGNSNFSTIQSGGTSLNVLFSHSGHTHQFSEILNTGHTHEFSTILNTAHTHSIGEVDNLNNVLNTKLDISAATSSVKIGNGLNTYTGGTPSNPTINVSGLTISDINASGSSIFSSIQSGNTNLNILFSHSGHTHQFSQILNTAHTHSVAEVGNLANILNTKLDASAATSSVQISNGLNTYTGGTPSNPTINVSGLNISILTVSGISNFNTINSGNTNLNTLFSHSGHTHQFFSILNTAHTHSVAEIGNLTNILNTKLDVSAATSSVQIGNGLNTYTGGTLSNPNINISALTISNINASGNATFNIIQSGNTNLNALFSHSGHTHQFSQILNTGHTHQFSEILNTAHTHQFSAILNTAHTHSISDVNNLTNVLNTKVDVSGLTNTFISNGLNTYTGGTIFNPTVNISGLTINRILVSGDSVFNGLTATTLYSGTTNIENIFVSTGRSDGLGVSIFKGKNGNTLVFKSIVGGGLASVSSTVDEITINVPTSPGAYIWQTNPAYTLAITLSGSGSQAYSNNVLVAGVNNNGGSSSSSILGGSNNRIRNGSIYAFIGSGFYNIVNYAPHGGVLMGAYNASTYNKHSLVTHGYSNQIKGQTNNPDDIGYNTIIGGKQNATWYSFNTVILNSYQSVIGVYTPERRSFKHSGIIGGVLNKNYADFSFIINSSHSYITKDSHNSSIIGASGGTIFTSNEGLILGGLNNYVRSSDYTQKRNFIIGGTNNYNYNSVNSIIISSDGGTLNTTENSGILGGEQHIIDTSINSFIIGGQNYSLIGENNTVLVPKLKIGNLPISTTNVLPKNIIVVDGFGRVYKSINNIDSAGGLSASTFTANTIYSGATELSSLLGEKNTASNLDAATGVFAQKVGVDLQFKSLSGGSNVTITSNGNVILISSTGGSSGSTSGGTSTNIGNGLNTYTGGTSTNPTVNISGATIADIRVSGTSIFNSLTATTISSGTTSLNNLFSHTGHTHIGGVGFVIDNGTSVITTGFKGCVIIPYSGIIQSWTVVGNVSGSVVIDVWKDTYNNYPPLVSDSIAGSEKITLSSQIKNKNVILSSWTTSVSAGDVISFNVDSANTINRATVLLSILKNN